MHLYPPGQAAGAPGVQVLGLVAPGSTYGVPVGQIVFGGGGGGDDEQQTLPVAPAAGTQSYPRGHGGAPPGAHDAGLVAPGGTNGAPVGQIGGGGGGEQQNVTVTSQQFPPGHFTLSGPQHRRGNGVSLRIRRTSPAGQEIDAKAIVAQHA